MKAIILAAGLGTRLRPMTENTPKALVKVNQKPLVEYQIEFLKERGIDDIIIVVGYLEEQFDYLKEKYGVRLVFNDKYADYNNFYSLYLVKKSWLTATLSMRITIFSKICSVMISSVQHISVFIVKIVIMSGS